MQAIDSTLPGVGAQQVPRKAKTPDGRLDCGPLLGEKLLALGLEQLVAGAGVDEHAQAAPLLDQLFVDQLLVSLEHRQRIDPRVGGKVADRRQRIALRQQPVEDHRHDPIADLAVDRLTIVPLWVHDPSWMALVRPPTILWWYS